MFRKESHRPDTDTVRLTPDGAAIVDIGKLLQKESVQRLMRDIRAKTKFIEVEKPRS